MGYMNRGYEREQQTWSLAATPLTYNCSHVGM